VGITLDIALADSGIKLESLRARLWQGILLALVTAWAVTPTESIRTASAATIASPTTALSVFSFTVTVVAIHRTIATTGRRPVAIVRSPRR